MQPSYRLTRWRQHKITKTFIYTLPLSFSLNIVCSNYNKFWPIQIFNPAAFCCPDHKLTRDFSFLFAQVPGFVFFSVCFQSLLAGWATQRSKVRGNFSQPHELAGIQGFPQHTASNRLVIGNTLISQFHSFFLFITASLGCFSPQTQMKTFVQI